MASELKLEVGKYYRTRDGRKVGPMEPHRKKEWLTDGKGALWSSFTGERYYGCAPADDLIAEWTDAPTGPVRTVTRKEIVPGVYGCVNLGAVDGDSAQIRLQNPGFLETWYTAAELRAAIATLTEIADALEEQA